MLTAVRTGYLNVENSDLVRRPTRSLVVRDVVVGVYRDVLLNAVGTGRSISTGPQCQP